MEAAWEVSERGRQTVRHPDLYRALPPRWTKRSISGILGSLANRGLVRAGPGEHVFDDFCVTCLGARYFGVHTSESCFTCEGCRGGIVKQTRRIQWLGNPGGALLQCAECDNFTRYQGVDELKPLCTVCARKYADEYRATQGSTRVDS